MAINKEIWTSLLAKNLYSESDWYTIGQNFNQYVSGTKVHIPQAVTTSVAVEVTGSTELPLSTGFATYSDLEYSMKLIAIAPTTIFRKDLDETNFPAQMELAADVAGRLKQAIDIEIAYDWTTIATGSTIRTTGSGRTNIYGKTSCKAITFDDILRARNTLKRNTKDVNAGNLYLIVDSVLASDIVKFDQFKYNNELAGQVAIKGYIGEVGGFKVIERALGIPITATNSTATTITVKAAVEYNDSHAAATTYSAALAIIADKVAYSVGTVENGQIGMNVTEPTGYLMTPVYEAFTRVGGSPMYTADGYDIIKGVVSIVETL